jgi:hypothetical protein
MTIGSWLEKLVNSETSNDKDWQVMTNVLRRKLGFTRAVVIYGVVYLDGQGTMTNPPRSIQSIAKSLLHSMRKEQSI